MKVLKQDHWKEFKAGWEEGNTTGTFMLFSLPALAVVSIQIQVLHIHFQWMVFAVIGLMSFVLTSYCDSPRGSYGRILWPLLSRVGVVLPRLRRIHRMMVKLKKDSEFLHRESANIVSRVEGTLQKVRSAADEDPERLGTVIVLAQQASSELEMAKSNLADFQSAYLDGVQAWESLTSSLLTQQDLLRKVSSGSEDWARQMLAGFGVASEKADVSHLRCASELCGEAADELIRLHQQMETTKIRNEVSEETSLLSKVARSAEGLAGLRQKWELSLRELQQAAQH